MSKWEKSSKSYEGFGKGMELGDNPEGIRFNHYDNDFEEQADSVNQFLNQVGDVSVPDEGMKNEVISSPTIDLSDPFYKEYMDLLVQTKIAQPELYETYLARTLDKLACCPVTESDIRQYVDSQVQIESLKNNLGKYFG